VPVSLPEMMMQNLLLGYAGATIDRAAARRRDAAWLEARLRDPASRVVRFHGDRPRIAVAGNPQATIAYDPPQSVAHLLDCGEAVLLGVAPTAAPSLPAHVHRKKPRTSASSSTFAASPFRACWRRAISTCWPRARALLNWHQRHRFCANCGKPTVLADAGYRRHCEAAAPIHFPRTDPVVILVAVNDGAACSAASRSFCPMCTRLWPASSSRANRWRKRPGARSWRKAASGSAPSAITRASHGRFRPV
jgi:NAD+ diphosphatase